MQVSVSVCVSVCLVVPWHRVDGCGRRDRLLLLLPGGKELTHHGVIQEPYTSGVKTVLILSHLVAQSDRLYLV